MSQMETRTIEIPGDVTVALEGKIIEVRGEKGKNIRDFSSSLVSIKKENNKIVVTALRLRRKESALVGTICSHIVNMIKGVRKGFTYKLIIAYSHFPISVKVERNRVVIENFIGERNPRVAKIVGDTKIIIKNDEILVQGINIENVSQTAANFEQATKVKKKDPRKFLDGIYVYEKLTGIMN